LKRKQERLTALFIFVCAGEISFGLDIGAVKGADALQPIVEYMPEFF